VHHHWRSGRDDLGHGNGRNRWHVGMVRLDARGRTGRSDRAAAGGGSHAGRVALLLLAGLGFFQVSVLEPIQEVRAVSAKLVVAKGHGMSREGTVHPFERACLA